VSAVNMCNPLQNYLSIDVYRGKKGLDKSICVCENEIKSKNKDPARNILKNISPPKILSYECVPL